MANNKKTIFNGTDEEVTAQLKEQGLTDEQIASVLEKVKAAKAQGAKKGFVAVDEKSGKVSVVTT